MIDLTTVGLPFALDVTDTEHTAPFFGARSVPFFASSVQALEDFHFTADRDAGLMTVDNFRVLPFFSITTGWAADDGCERVWSALPRDSTVNEYLLCAVRFAKVHELPDVVHTFFPPT